jgi:GR25 family glycosyltransferase involved in LPS biosynthesis
MNKILDDLVGENNWKAYCISLERCSDRRKNFDKWTNDIDLNFQYWNATDKNTLEEAFVKVNGILNMGATACSLSHYHLYKHLLKTYDCDYFFILEDDCGFKNSSKDELFEFMKHINRFNFNWDMLWFGYHETGFKRLTPITSHICYVVNTHLSHAFFVKRELLEFILQIFEVAKEHPIDWVIDITRQKKAVTLGPVKTIIDQVDDYSFIWDKIN